MTFMKATTFSSRRGATTLKRILLVFALLLLGPVFVSAQADLRGFWVLRVPTGDGNYRETFFEPKQVGETVTGRILLGSRELPISDGTFKDGNLHFVVTFRGPSQERQVTYDGTMECIPTSRDAAFPETVVKGHRVRKLLARRLTASPEGESCLR
jgi:hypothetical protein